MTTSGIDLIRDGIGIDLLTAKGGGRRLFGALVSTAMWAQQRGMTETDWCALLDEPKSTLGRQNRLRSNGATDTPKRSRDRLSLAWKRAAEHIAESPRWTPDDARRIARESAQAARDLAADADNDLTKGERALLDAVAKIADERGSDRLTLPTGNHDTKTGERTGLVCATGMGLTAVRTALRGLAERGLLILVEQGRPRSKGRPVRANVYRLVTRSNPGDGVAMPRALSSDAPPLGAHDAPALISDAQTEPQEANDMDHITLTREQIVQALGEAALARLLEAQQERPGADVRHLRPVKEGAGE